MLDNAEVWDVPAKEQTVWRIEFFRDESSRRVFRAKVVIPPCNRRETAQSNFSKLTSKVIDAAIRICYATHTENKLVSSICYKEARRTLPTTMDYAAVSFPKV